MKAPTSATRFSNATSLLDYGFNNFSYQSFGNSGDVVKEITVTKGDSESVNAVYETSPSFLIKKGEESSVTYEISLDDSVQAPVTEGQQLGTISYYLMGEKIAEVSLVAESSVSKMNFFSMVKSIINNWFSLVRF